MLRFVLVFRRQQHHARLSRVAHAWALDLSGTEQGAGGIGGLAIISAAASVLNPTAATYVPLYDGHASVVSLRDTSTNELAAYTYGPYGETTAAIGSRWASNPFRFSTKFTDAESGLVYYGYRYYLPSQGRWCSKDPIEESGGLNLFECANNAPVINVDAIGLTARAWLTSHIKHAVEKAMHAGVYRAEGKRSLSALGQFDIQFKYGVIGQLKTKDYSTSCNKCASVSGYAAVAGQFKSARIPWLLGAQLIVEPTFAAAGKIECCIAPVGGQWEVRIESLYCRGDITFDLGVKLGLRWGLSDWSGVNVYAEGGGYIGGQYSFRRNEFRVTGYFYATAVAEFDFLGWKRSRRVEYRWGTSLDF